MPNRAALLHGQTVFATTSHCRPVRVIADADWRCATRLRTISQLTVMVGSPGPETPVLLQSEHVAAATRHGFPIGLASNLDRRTLMSDRHSPLQRPAAPGPQGPVVFDCHIRAWC